MSISIRKKKHAHNLIINSLLNLFKFMRSILQLSFSSGQLVSQLGKNIFSCRLNELTMDHQYYTISIKLVLKLIPPSPVSSWLALINMLYIFPDFPSKADLKCQFSLTQNKIP